MQNDLIEIRPMAETDLPFIYSTWIHAIYNGNRWDKNMLIHKGPPFDFYSEMDEPIFHENYRKVIERLMRRSSVKVACLKEDNDVILGWSCSEPEVLHFVFVKDAWRRMGIAKDLVPGNIQFITHLTKIGQYAKKGHWKFNPFLI